MTTKIRCHYEVLGVERDANSDDLKKSYRKLALKFHPDKNPDNIDEATSQFRLVQQAYEVLSDSQERAWYDKHREAILRGGLGGGEKYDDDSLDLFQYFNTSCYSGFGDDDSGFYAVYGKVFENLAEEDYVFMPDRKKEEEFPKFGGPDSDYDEVVGPFYAFWSFFCTNKSYVWEEKYDTREAPDRRSRRLMEADNKKMRDAAKKERNEEIRNLVAYVKKRDKRVQAYKKKLEERNAEIEKKAKEKRSQELRERQKQMENYKEAGWSAMSNFEKDLQQLEAHLNDHFGEDDYEPPENNDETEETNGADEEELFLDDLYCVACNKTFKSDKAFSNHEKSRKHKEMVAIIAEQMREEEAQEKEDQDEEEDEEGREEGADTEAAKEEQKVKSDKPETDDIIDEQDILDELELSSSEEEITQRLSKKQKKKKRQKALFQAEEDTIAEKVAEVKLSEPLPTKSSKKARRKAAKLGVFNDQTQESKENTYNTPESLAADNKKEENADKIEPDEVKVEEGVLIDSKNATELAEQAQEEVDSMASEETKNEEKKGNMKNKNQKQKESLKCHVCQKGYNSRNKLFDHIKQTGHALRLDQPTSGAEAAEADEGRGKKGKKKNKR